MDPQQLYELWERQQWQSQTIDFTKDKADWAGLDEDDKANLSWNLSSFFVGEERVTTQFTGLVAAYEDQGEEAFLATQQVDEARHAQHFNRFYEQVLGIDGTFEDRLDRAREDLNEAFLELFDVHLVAGVRPPDGRPHRPRGEGRLRHDLPHDHRGHARADRPVLPSPTTARSNDILPGFLEGFRNISRDEHRHVAYGTWYLQQAARDPGLKRRIQEKLFELIPLAAGVLIPTGQDPDNYSILGYSSEETNGYAFTALTRRLKVIGVSLTPEGATA